MSPVWQPESMNVTATLHLQDVNELCPLPLILIRRDHMTVMPHQASNVSHYFARHRRHPLVDAPRRMPEVIPTGPSTPLSGLVPCPQYEDASDE
jgi:hypothetical protein